MDFNAIINDFAAGQALAIRLSQAGDSVRDIGDDPDSAVDPNEQEGEGEAEVTCEFCSEFPDYNGTVCWNCKDVRKQNAELLARGGGDL